MATSTEARFDTWLSQKLLKLNPDVDLDVFVSYISGILEADTPDDEKTESIFGILGELAVILVPDWLIDRKISLAQS